LWDRWHGATLWAMRNSSRISFAGVALALSITTAPPVPAQDRNVTLTESQNGGGAELAKDQKLEIRLPVQGGTGFSWELMRPPRAPVRLLSSNAQPAGPGNLPGGPATQLFVFEPTGAGSGDILATGARGRRTRNPRAPSWCTSWCISGWLKPRRASSAGWSTRSCIGTRAACPDRRSGKPSAPSGRPRGSRIGST